MREADTGEPYQGVLFEVAAQPSHWFYGTTNVAVFKIGSSKDVARRMKSPEFKGHKLVFRVLCSCPREGDECERETWFGRVFAKYRLSSSEQYWCVPDTDSCVEGIVGSDKRGRAVLAWMHQVKATRRIA